MSWKFNWRQPIAFVHDWKTNLLIGAILGGFIAFIQIALQPLDTYYSDIPFKNLKLAGYGLCIAIPVLIMFFLEKFIYYRQGKHWYLLNEIIYMSSAILVMISLSYLHNTLIINHIQPSFINGWYFFTHISLPYVPLIFPIWAFLRQYWGKKNVPDPSLPLQKLEITGQNKSDVLRIPDHSFVMARAQQNYMEIYHLDAQEKVQKTLLRLTLAQLKNQIPQAWQVHRSYLINPDYYRGLDGNARKRFIRLSMVEEAIPFSHKYYQGLEKKLSNLSQKFQPRP